jgi:uncharacterized protein YprB with RNaseH-like and TPR domain
MRQDRSDPPGEASTPPAAGRADTMPTLPPESGTPARVLALSGVLVQRVHSDTLASLVDAVAPDAVIATPPQAATVRPAVTRQLEVPLVQAGRGMRPDVVVAGDGAIVIAALAGGDAHLTADAVDDALGRGVHAGERPTGAESAHRVVVTDALALTVDPYARRTTLEGLDGYRDRLFDGWSGPDTTHLSTRLRPGFRTADPLSIVGIGVSEATLGVGADTDATTAAVVDVYPNGAVDTDAVDPTDFGLRGVTQVGATRADTLREAGIQTPADLAAASLHDLAALDGLGRATAQTIQVAAQARVEDRVIPTGDDPLPTGEPVFIDIETDGLTPSTAWLIGVLDGDAADGTYLPFREDRPGDGAHLEAFMDWLTTSGAGRPVVAWNGYGFDFPVIEDQLREHCPGYVADWQDTYTVDALWWARDKNGGNAALPGRSNTLEAVATALGWEPASTGIDGATVAELYVAYRRAVEQAAAPAQVTEPDWARLERYCEDDVRALATIYGALQDAARRDPETKSVTGEDTTQGALSDFG